MRLIDADALYETAKNIWDHADSEDFEKEIFIAIATAPTIEERKKGEWIYGEDEYGIDGYHCDKCGFFVPWDYAYKFINYIENYKFCPNCGADMKGNNDD